jgi:hypothetical protein
MSVASAPRDVDVLALGLHGISEDEVSWICKGLDGQGDAIRTRPVSGDDSTCSRD